MTKKKYYYKKLAEHGSLLQSISGIDNLTLNYKIGKWKKPRIKDTGLFVFDTLENANNFWVSGRIFKCEVKNPRKIKTILNVTMQYDTSSKIIKKIFKKELKDILTMYAPTGTYVCDELKLIKEVI